MGMNLENLESMSKEKMKCVASDIMRCIRERKMLCPKVDDAMAFVDFSLDFSVRLFNVLQHRFVNKAAEVDITAIELYAQGKDENNEPTSLVVRIEYDKSDPTVVQYRTAGQEITASVSRIAVEAEEALKKLHKLFITEITRARGYSDIL